ncbi:TIGR03668 family PPOX class F420-dependent oxidoreductase [Actinocrispum sp. NPDC049592]|uniref:TIGR03668 family PPOX class F420-dependent oxidoreductase n=1 Tax=Actinocrispum sp. NPDC049592 TaxID=3154835 RepID=UPI00343FBA7E
MRLSTADAHTRFAQARVARLATMGPHIVPVTFVLHEDTIVIAVDHKPKTTRNLKRLRNIETDPHVSVLVDEYNDDWTQLWWVRADGTATISETPSPELVAKYPQYQQNPPEGPFIRIAIETLTGWSAS